MTTTSLKLPAERKQGVLAAASQLGLTPHAFMLSAIEEFARAAWLREEFVAQAQAARTESPAPGQGFQAEDVEDVVLLLAFRHQSEPGAF